MLICLQDSQASNDCLKGIAILLNMILLANKKIIESIFLISGTISPDS